MLQTAKHQPNPSSRHTQRSRILRLLIDARGSEVPAPELAAIALQYGARILELRRLGFRIENRREKRDGKIVSWFRLVPNRSISTLDQPRVALEKIQESKQGEPQQEAPLSLFGDLTPAHRDLG